jgi:nucleotide-binding universal stress UspA family protein
MKKILCPTDFSEPAHTASAYAAKLANATGCTLTLLHVKSIFEYSFAETSGAKHASSDHVEDELEVQSMEISKTFKISCYADVVSKLRSLSSVIANEAKKYDLVVMGSNGIDDLFQFLNGSNTYNAIVKSRTPVMLIPPGFTYCEIRSMVYAFDYLRERKLPMSHLAPFIKAVSCRLTVLQVIEEAFSRDVEEDLKGLQFILKTYDTEGIAYEFDTIRASDVSQSINAYVQRTQPDMLALCSVHRGLIESIFHKSLLKSISAITAYPVYVFHE